MELLVPTRSGIGTSLFHDESGGPDRHSRQRVARGFQQAAVDRATLIRAGQRTDPIARHLSLLAGAMGVRSQVLIREDGRLPADESRRAMLLDEHIRVIPASAEIVRIALIAEPRRPVYAIADAREDTAGFDLATFYHCRTRGSIVFGTDRKGVLERAGNGARDHDPEHPGAEAILVAALALADMLASIGAYRSPFTGRGMPRCPAVNEVPVIEGEPRVSQLKMMVVGCGAAGHALLEAVLVDPLIRRALEGGQLPLVDHDRVSDSNLSRQPLFGGRHSLDRLKAEVTAEQVRHRLPEGRGTEVVGVADAFHPGLVEQVPPDVIVLSPDSFEARDHAFGAVRHREGALALYLATEMTQAVERGVVAGQGVCLDCGPEELGRLAAESSSETPPLTAQGTPPEGAGCGREFTPSNVCTNAIAGAYSALSLKRWLVQGDVEPRQRCISWTVPSRVTWGDGFADPCSCWRAP